MDNTLGLILEESTTHSNTDHSLAAADDCATAFGALNLGPHPVDASPSRSAHRARIAHPHATPPRSHSSHLAAVAAKAQHSAAAALRAGADALENGSSISTSGSAPLTQARSQQNDDCIITGALRSLSSSHDVLHAAMLEAGGSSPQAVTAADSESLTTRVSDHNTRGSRVVPEPLTAEVVPDVTQAEAEVCGVADVV